jgi:hypothetical protein
MQPFMNMDLSVHSHAIAWMAIDNHFFVSVFAGHVLLLEKVLKKRTIGIVEYAQDHQIFLPSWIWSWSHHIAWMAGDTTCINFAGHTILLKKVGVEGNENCWED